MAEPTNKVAVVTGAANGIAPQLRSALRKTDLLSLLIIAASRLDEYFAECVRAYADMLNDPHSPWRVRRLNGMHVLRSRDAHDRRRDLRRLAVNSQKSTDSFTNVRFRGTGRTPHLGRIAQTASRLCRCPRTPTRSSSPRPCSAAP